jgi:hypothetical protein
MLARVGFLERHPEQFDASVKSAIDELGVENRRADVVEARAMHAEALLAEGKLEDARDTVEKAAALRATDWLARLRLSASSAQLEAARGNDSAARQQLVAAIAEAHRAGCVVCQAEVSALLSKLDSKRSLRTGKEAQSPALTD